MKKQLVICRRAHLCDADNCQKKAPHLAGDATGCDEEVTAVNNGVYMVNEPIAAILGRSYIEATTTDNKWPCDFVPRGLVRL